MMTSIQFEFKSIQRRECSLVAEQTWAVYNLLSYAKFLLLAEILADKQRGVLNDNFAS